MNETRSTPHQAARGSGEPFEYKNLKQGEFWRHIPAYKDVDEATFLDHLWQQKNAVKTADELLSTIKGVCSPEFYADAEAGFRASADGRARFALRDLADRLERSDRRIRSAASSCRSPPALLPDHPRLTLDSLHEQDDSPVPGLVHRYVDKALFLAAEHVPGVLPVLHAQLRDRPGHRERR